MRVLIVSVVLGMVLTSGCASAPDHGDPGGLDVATSPAEEADAPSRPSRTREQISMTIATSRDAVEACYQQALMRDPDVAGRLTMEIEIAPDGGVTSVTPIEDDLNSPETTACVVDVFGQLRFVPGSTATSVNYPITFATERGTP